MIDFSLARDNTITSMQGRSSAKDAQGYLRILDLINSEGILAQSCLPRHFQGLDGT